MPVGYNLGTSVQSLCARARLSVEEGTCSVARSFSIITVPMLVLSHPCESSTWPDFVDLTVQGILTDDLGAPIHDGTYELFFDIRNQEGFTVYAGPRLVTTVDRRYTVLFKSHMAGGRPLQPGSTAISKAPRASLISRHRIRCSRYRSAPFPTAACGSSGTQEPSSSISMLISVRGTSCRPCGVRAGFENHQVIRTKRQTAQGTPGIVNRKS